ncbi:MAG: hypothetical protein IVW54_04215 [Candidatus Binataceae bacterium]|nr:hypothetical protein [Candidatus Binataceae bacterium]
MVAAFGLPEDDASAIANAVVDPSAVRKSIGEPADPEAENIAVPGGTLLGIRTMVWSRRIMPDPRNPRLLPSRRHPFAVEPGTGGENAKFRPVPEPRTRDSANPDAAVLSVDIESRHHVTWACQQAATFILAENDWRASIASQGVMEAVWLVVTRLEHADGSAPANVLISAEGSSRMTGVHDLLEIRSADVPYDDHEAKLRANIRKLNEALDRGPTAEQLVALRCERVPALILVGFKKHSADGSAGFPTAVKSLVALRHVDPPMPWGDGPENESLADEVLDELFRRDLISETERAYLAGSCTRAEARAARLADDPAMRAARIVHLFTTKDSRVAEAIRVAVTSQSTRKRITTKLANELATALILRATADDRARTDQMRRYLRDAFGKAVHSEHWEDTGRDTATLRADALRELPQWVQNQCAGDPGPSSLELAVRGAYALVVSGRLNADRGSRSNEQPDRRTPGEVLDAMRRNVQGTYQLSQALDDFAAELPLRAVDENGQVKKQADGIDQKINDVYLRGEFPAAGKARSARPGNTPLELHQNRLSDFSLAIDRLQQAFEAISAVIGDDGRPVVETQGADPTSASAWRETLDKIDEELIVWSRTFKRLHGAAQDVVVAHDADGHDEGTSPEHEDHYLDSDESLQSN